MTLGQVVAEIAAAHGYESSVDPDLAAEPIAHIDRTAESDLNLLCRTTRHYNATMKAVAGRLVVVRTGSARTAGTGQPLPIVAIDAPPSGVSPSISGRVVLRGLEPRFVR